MKPISNLQNYQRCLYSTQYLDTVYNYISIPKTGSTNLRLGFTSENTKSDVPNQTGNWFTVIRNPYTRVLRGLLTHNKLIKNKITDINLELSRLLHNPKEYDCHLETQHWFLHNVPTPSTLHLYTLEDNFGPKNAGSPLQQFLQDIPAKIDCVHRVCGEHQETPIEGPDVDQTLLDQVVKELYELDFYLWKRIHRVGGHLTMYTKYLRK